MLRLPSPNPILGLPEILTIEFRRITIAISATVPPNSQRERTLLSAMSARRKRPPNPPGGLNRSNHESPIATNSARIERLLDTRQAIGMRPNRPVTIRFMFRNIPALHPLKPANHIPYRSSRGPRTLSLWNRTNPSPGRSNRTSPIRLPQSIILHIQRPPHLPRPRRLRTTRHPIPPGAEADRSGHSESETSNLKFETAPFLLLLDSSGRLSASPMYA
jgi:hypothetical protein